MKIVLRFVIAIAVITSGVLPAAARKKPSHQPPANKAIVEAATRLQVFLDRANFSPGKIDGTYNEFTWKALALYRESRGELPRTPAPQTRGKANVAPNVTGHDLNSIGPV